MKAISVVLLLLTIISAINTEVKVNWREFISRSDPLWKFSTNDEKSMPTMWFDSPFHGNGNLGMLVIAEKLQRNNTEKYIIRFDVGRADVWDVRMKGSKYAHGDR